MTHHIGQRSTRDPWNPLYKSTASYDRVLEEAIPWSEKRFLVDRMTGCKIIKLNLWRWSRNKNNTKEPMEYIDFTAPATMKESTIFSIIITRLGFNLPAKPLFCFLKLSIEYKRVSSMFLAFFIQFKTDRAMIAQISTISPEILERRVIKKRLILTSVITWGTNYSKTNQANYQKV